MKGKELSCPKDGIKTHKSNRVSHSYIAESRFSISRGFDLIQKRFSLGGASLGHLPANLFRRATDAGDIDGRIHGYIHGGLPAARLS
jgi:hypothetical protein